MKRIIFRLMLLMTCLLSLVCCSQENVPDPYHPGLINPPLPSIDDRHHSAYFGNAEYDFEEKLFHWEPVFQLYYDYATSLVGYVHDEVIKWREENKHLTDKLTAEYDRFENEYKKLHNMPAEWRLRRGTFIYDFIKNVEVVANKPLLGRAAGEDISDLCSYSLGSFVYFGYDDIEIKNWDAVNVTPSQFWRRHTLLTKEELIAGRYMMVERLLIMFNGNEYVGSQEDVTFKVTIRPFSAPVRSFEFVMNMAEKEADSREEVDWRNDLIQHNDYIYVDVGGWYYNI